MSRAAVRALVAAALIAVCASVTAWRTGVLDGTERATISTRFDLRGAQRPNDIAIVAIDDATFGQLHQQWPFPRSRHAELIDRLHAAGAREIVYDVQFTEPTTPDQDGALYDSIGRAGGVVLATSESDGHGHTNVLGGDANLATVNAQAAASNFVDTSSGEISRYPFSVAGLKSIAVVAAERAGRRITATKGSAWIDYRGAPGTFPRLSFGDVVSGHFDPRAVRGKIVVVGATAPTLQDVHPTPVDGRDLMPGPEVEANAIWTALHGNPLRSAPPWLALLAIILLGSLPALVRLRLPLWSAVLAGAAGAAAYAVAAQLAFDAGTMLLVVAPLVAAGLGTVGTVAASYLVESRERRRVARDNAALEAAVRERTEELRDAQLEIISRLGAAVESRDFETGAHIERISSLTYRLARAVGLGERDAELLSHASAMHDVGKIAIPDFILLKPGKLDDDEWELMKTHTTVGASILAGSRSAVIQLAEEIALTHHERWDGSGYPRGLRGEEIPLPGRICAICDVFDALISVRPYKHPWTAEEALAEIERSSGSHFDPALAAAFVEMAPAILAELAGEAGAQEPVPGQPDPAASSASR